MAAILDESGWILPSSNHSDVITFRLAFDYSRPHNVRLQDHVLWDSTSLVSTSSIWNSIRRRSQEVDWCSLVWNKIYVPRFSFSLWLAFHKGFKTKDVLIRYGIDTSAECRLCSNQIESFQHLFFQCPYSFHVFFCVLRFCGWKGFHRDWIHIVDYVLHLNLSKLRRSILSLGLAATVYYIWRERNNRVHGEPSKLAACLGREIIHIIKCRLHSSTMFRKKAASFAHMLISNLA